MASTLPSSNYKLYPNEPFIAPQEFATQSSDANNNNNNNNNNTNMHYGLSMFLGEEDCYSPLFNNFDNLSLLSGYTNNIDCYSSDFNSSMMMMDVPSFGTSGLDYYNSQIKGHSTTNSSGSTTCDEFDSNAYSTLLQDYAPSANSYGATTLECWGFQGHTTQACGTDITSHNNNNNNNAKVGKYSVEERKDRILRYLKKRNQRNFRKTIKYACRKTLADRRVRVRGRFAKNQDDQESPTDYNYQTNQQDSVELRYNTADHKIEQYSDSNEEWLQETMSSLLYAPYISGWHRESP